jgi:hypothetical protein
MRVFRTKKTQAARIGSAAYRDFQRLRGDLRQQKDTAGTTARPTAPRMHDGVCAHVRRARANAERAAAMAPLRAVKNADVGAVGAARDAVARSVTAWSSL